MSPVDPTTAAMRPAQRLCVLGATGSIGRSTLDVVSRHPDRFAVTALTGFSQADRLFELCERFRPRMAVTADAAGARDLGRRLRAAGLDCEVLHGPEGLARAAALSEVTTVVAGIVGAAGLLPTLAAAAAGKRVLLANKESLVMSGDLFMRVAAQSGAEIIPLDSEHSAIFQCLPPHARRDLPAAGVRALWLTASGGPFRTLPAGRLATVTPEEACAHPNWQMGRKISVDSATLMNKGLEVIEARWLFDAPPGSIRVVVHPQSVVHSMVEYEDGAVLAQLGAPDMRGPIAYALAYPERVDAGVARLNFFELGRLDFEAPDGDRFPALGLAYQSLAAGGTAPAVLNAANEVAVEAFLAGRVTFDAIPGLIRHALDRIAVAPVTQLDDVLAADARAREVVRARLP